MHEVHPEPCRSSRRDQPLRHRGDLPGRRDRIGPAAPAAGRQLAAGPGRDAAGRLHPAHPGLAAVRGHRGPARRGRREPGRRPDRDQPAGPPRRAGRQPAGPAQLLPADRGRRHPSCPSAAAGSSRRRQARAVGPAVDADRLLAAAGGRHAAARPAQPAAVAGIRAAVRRTVDLAARAHRQDEDRSSLRSPSAP